MFVRHIITCFERLMTTWPLQNTIDRFAAYVSSYSVLAPCMSGTSTPQYPPVYRTRGPSRLSIGKTSTFAVLTLLPLITGAHVFPAYSSMSSVSDPDHSRGRIRRAMYKVLTLRGYA